ncbi:MAG TPA: alpha/beta hydrolase [Dermatophilaceae bacterium]|nr:alpha/beta hydrolase [Dermatophilaceae bacterium]
MTSTTNPPVTHASTPPPGPATRWLPLGAALGLAWGLLAGWWTPRGPLTTAEAVASIAISLLVGAAAGLLTRSRWPMLLTPLAFVVGVELARAGVTGPSVDLPRLSEYGLFAFVTGRGVHGLLSVVPMVLGAAYGAGVARTWAARRSPGAGATGRGGWHVWRVLRALVAGATAAALVLLVVALVRPARTDAITGSSATPVAELTTVRAGGHDLRLMVRGHDVSAPVLLFLAGGPGGSELGAMRRHLPELEEHYVVATLDQRGTGASYSELDPTSTYTLDRAVQDVVDVTAYLRDRFDTDTVVLSGQSGGTVVGVLAVQREPAAYSAFVGVGQMVSQVETDRIFYSDTLAWARRAGEGDLAADLERIGPPPYDSMLDYETALSHEQEVYPYDHTGNSEGSGGFSENFLVEEYSLLDQVHLLPAFMDTFSVLYPQTQEAVDFRRTARTLPVPVFFVQGAHEARGRQEPFEQWYAALSAPSKDLVVLDRSGHRPLFEQPEEFVAYLAGPVLDAVR